MSKIYYILTLVWLLMSSVFGASIKCRENGKRCLEALRADVKDVATSHSASQYMRDMASLMVHMERRLHKLERTVTNLSRKIRSDNSDSPGDLEPYGAKNYGNAYFAFHKDKITLSVTLIRTGNNYYQGGGSHLDKRTHT